MFAMCTYVNIYSIATSCKIILKRIQLSTMIPGNIMLISLSPWNVISGVSQSVWILMLRGEIRKYSSFLYKIYPLYSPHSWLCLTSADVKM